MIVQQIIPGTFEYALPHIVDKHLDLSSFDEWYNNDNGGAAAYPPSVMLKIVLFGYSRGLVSSLRIARACEINITFMSLSGDAQPHYTSVANFVANMKDQIEPLFTQVLMICDREGLIGRNMFAIDGCFSFFNEQDQTRVKNGVVRLTSLSENKSSYVVLVNAYLSVIKHKIV